MCGIAGYLGNNESVIKETNTVLNMMKIQKYRGPDDSGLVGYSLSEKKFIEFRTDIACAISLNCNGILGFNRLSIRDLSINGHQPMVDLSGKVSISFNGEIYNADEIKKELLILGHVFRSTTDTEVILESYLEYGFEKMIKKLNGMFAFIIVDLRTGCSYLARDRAGIKPLYFYLDNHFGKIGVYYSSELKAFLKVPSFDKTLNMDAVYEKFLYRSGIYASFFKRVDEVKPGEYIVFNGENIQRKTYFSINDYNRPRFSIKNFSIHKKELENVLQDSIDRQMISDVKVGCQLSGGVDSSLVCYYAKKLNPNMMQDSISIVPTNSLYSEEKYMDHVTNIVGLNPHKISFDEDIVMKTIDKTIWHVETTPTHASVLALLQLSKNAKQFVTVLLSGEGSDELMGGYSCWYEPMFRRWSKYPHKRDMDEFETAVSTMEIDTNIKILKNAIPNLDVDKFTQQRKNIFHKMEGDVMTRMMKYHFRTYLPEVLLRQDKTTMANSIENRVPILDNKMIDYVYSLPVKNFVSGEQWHTSKRMLLRGQLYRQCKSVRTKYLLKELCSDKFGRDFSYRNKLGFPMPLVDYMCSPIFKRRYEDEILPSIKNRGVFDWRIIDKLYQKQMKMGYSEGETMWRFLTFEIWFKIFVDGKYNFC